MRSLRHVREIKVGLNFGVGITPVGRFAVRNRTIYFEYDRMFVDHGLEISPVSLPLNPGVSRFEYDLFEGLPGVFNDSLPDGWGRLLFDRDGDKRYHMHTACGLLHSDFRTPSLDYEDLIALTGALTRDVREIEKMYRLAVFNVLAHNRDDHAKNFSFLMDADGHWKLSPAYDLTFSSGPGGEQSTTVMGEGRDPGLDHLTKLGVEANLKPALINKIIEQTRSALGDWKELAKQYGVSGPVVELVTGKIS